MRVSLISSSRLAFQQFWLNADPRRAVRCTLAFMSLLLAARLGWIRVEGTFAALAAHAICLLEVRGPYPLRLGFLVAMLGVTVGAAALGSMANGQHVAWAIVATIIVAANAGLWRHLTPDYGMTLSIPTGFLFLLALAIPKSPPGHVYSTMIGGLTGLTFQIFFWPFHAQHPLRRAIAETWLAAGDLFLTLSRESAAGGLSNERVTAAEQDLRTALERGYGVLTRADARQPRLSALQHIHQAAGRTAMRVVGTAMAVESACPPASGTDFCASWRGVLDSLANMSQSIALTVVSGQPSHLAMCEVRLARVDSLLQALRGNCNNRSEAEQFRSRLPRLFELAIEQVRELAPAIAAVTERAKERAVFPLELFDLRTWTLRPFAEALNLRQRVEPTIVRFSVRLALLLTVGVMAMRWTGLPHAYWLPLTMLVVLQPDFGATRKRAAERLTGTLIGGIIASLLLLLHPGPPLVLALAAVACFGFSYYVRTHYGVAVVFITLFVILLTEINQHATIALAAERLAITVIGGAVAILGALFIWPTWERDSYPLLLRSALTASMDYIRAIASRAQNGGPYTAAEVGAKRRAEAANVAIFASLARMMADPRERRGGVKQAAVLVNGNQKLIRICNFILLNIESIPRADADMLGDFANRAWMILGSLGANSPDANIGRDLESGTEPARMMNNPRGEQTEVSVTDDAWLRAQLAQAQTELDAMMANAVYPSDILLSSDI